MELIEALQGKDDKAAYNLFLKLQEEVMQSNKLYNYFDEFVKLTHHQSSFVRVRGFALCCWQVQWDEENKLKDHIDELLRMLEDDKPSAVRQCLSVLHHVIYIKPEFGTIIKLKLDELDLSRYKETMRPLLEKDIINLRKAINSIKLD